MIAIIPIFLKFIPPVELSSDFLTILGLISFSFLGASFLTSFLTSFLGTSFLTSLVSVSFLGKSYFLAGFFIPVSFCLKPSVAVFEKLGLELCSKKASSLSFLSCAAVL